MGNMIMLDVKYYGLAAGCLHSYEAHVPGSIKNNTMVSFCLKSIYVASGLATRKSDWLREPSATTQKRTTDRGLNILSVFAAQLLHETSSSITS